MKDKGTIKSYFETWDKPTQKQFADLIESSIGCIGKLIKFDLNSILVQEIPLSGGSKYIITDILVMNPSIPISTAKNLGFFADDQLSDEYFVGSGDIHANFENLQFLDGANNYMSMKDIYTQYLHINSSPSILPAITQPFASGPSIVGILDTAQGAAATCDVYVFGFPVL